MGQTLVGSKNGLLPMRCWTASSGELEFPDGGWLGGWLQGEIEGQAAYSNGHFMLVGEPPQMQPIAPRRLDFAKALAAIREAGEALVVRAVAFGPTRDGHHLRAVWFSNGAVVAREYYDHILRRYPRAEFRNAGMGTGLLIYDGEQLVGALMPLRADMVGVTTEEALAAGRL